MNDLKMELIQLNEAIDMCTMALDMGMKNRGEYDPQLVEQLKKLLDEKTQIVQKINTLN